MNKIKTIIGMCVLILLVGCFNQSPDGYIQFGSPENDDRIGYCYHKSPCATYIYLEQQVGCYQGCKFAFDTGSGDCINKCVNYYNNTYRQYD